MLIFSRILWLTIWCGEIVFSWLSDEKPYRKEIKKFFEGADRDIVAYPNSGCWIGYGWAALAFLDVGGSRNGCLVCPGSALGLLAC